MAVQWRAVGGAVVGLVAGIRDAVRRRRAGRRPQLRRAWVERCVGGWCIRRSDGLMYVGSDVPVQWHPLGCAYPNRAAAELALSMLVVDGVVALLT